MIPNHTNRNVQTSGVAATGEFQISLSHSAHIMRILRSQLYSDKILAVLREYSANAWDANKEVGRGDVPIKVTLPTVADPTLYIRDFGPGISHEDMFAIYSQYGVSTKRSSNGQVGMLGIGSKSGFAYTDSFTITTWQNKSQRIYTALMNNDDKGTLNLLDESSSDESDGTLIQIPVKISDIPEFVKKAEDLFLHFKPRPDINIALAPEVIPETLLKHGSITKGSGRWYVVMGCISYRIDLSQLRGLNAHRGGASNFLNGLDGFLYFDIGQVEIAASRETLEYSDKTKIVLIDKFIDLVDEFVTHTLNCIEQGDFTFWDKRCRAQVLHELGLPVPKLLTSLADDYVHLGDTKTFIVTYGPKQAVVKNIAVGSMVRLLVRDEIRNVEGYGLSGDDYIIRINKDVTPLPTIEDVRKELDQVIVDKNIAGVQVLNLSKVPWHQKAKFSVLPKKKVNRKHQVKLFVLKDKHGYYSPWSNAWDIQDHEPKDDDVYVMLRSFKVVKDIRDKEGSTEFYRQVRNDINILSGLNVKIPTVYGYKITDKSTVDIKGKKYSEWRKEYFSELAKREDVRALCNHLNIAKLTSRYNNRYYRDVNNIPKKIISKLFSSLPSNHPILGVFRKILISIRVLKRTPIDTKNAGTELMHFLESDHIKTEQFKNPVEGIEDLYPMFKMFDKGLMELRDEDNDNLNLWLDYIRLVDGSKKGLNNVEETSIHSNGRDDIHHLGGEGICTEERSAQLCESDERDQRGGDNWGMGEDRESSISFGDGEGMVEQQIHDHRRLGDILRATSPSGYQP